MNGRDMHRTSDRKGGERPVCKLRAAVHRQDTSLIAGKAACLGSRAMSGAGLYRRSVSVNRPGSTAIQLPPPFSLLAWGDVLARLT